MADEVHIDRGAEGGPRTSGRASVGQSMTLMVIAVFLAAGVQAFSGLELLPRLALGAGVVLVVTFVGFRIIRRRSLRAGRPRP
ncbi:MULTISPECIES: hypothetical protein [Clavibacter]|uniref:hypothetical protein n=1 Tax=Clavibacter TaxID=1573 RepID=UPI001041E189|nr:hypothetical protein [Clavibacter michiganensis]